MDSLPNDYELANGLNPNNPADASQDPDADGLTNLQEFQRGTNPRSPDTDGDGILDGTEVQLGTNPVLADSDSDGIPDGDEARRGTNPLSSDTDGDGIADGLEILLGLNPTTRDTITSVRGRILDPQNNPLPGASAILFNRLTATSDNTGQFTIPIAPATLGNITVTAQAVQNGQLLSGISLAIAPVINGVTNVGDIRLVLDSGTVSGIVRNPQGQPVAGAQVSVDTAGTSRTGQTDGTGRYTIRNVAAGGLSITAVDFTTGLRARSSGVMPANQSTTLDLQLGPSGTVTGIVFGRDGVTPAGAGVTVTLKNSVTHTTQTDGLGRYTFDFIPLGNYTVEAADNAGNRGRSGGTLLFTSRTVVADITFLGKGTVTGIVKDASGAPSPGASVELNSSSLFGGKFTATTDPAGRYTISGVFAGPFSVLARPVIARLAGQTAGTIEREGQSVTADVTLAPAGTLTGTVFRSNGTTPVPGANVILSPAGLGATTDAQGAYRFEFIPVGSYVLNVTDPATGDRGTGTGAIAAQDEVKTVNVLLTGQGQVTVQVRGVGSQPVPGARVTLNGPFSTVLEGVTQPDGSLTFPRVIAGTFTVSAFDPATAFSGSATGTATVGGSAVVTVQLQTGGAISGTVLGPDGTTPVSGISVRLTGPVTRTETSAGNGTFRFDLTPLGNYTLEAIDAAGNVRDRKTATVSSQGQQVIVNLTLSGVGTISGVIFAPNGTTPIAGATVRLQGTASRQLVSSGTGTFQFDALPVGSYALEALDTAGILRARATGLSIATQGQILNRNLTFIGLGVVSGRVSFPNASPAQGVTVSLTSQAGDFARNGSATTDANGNFSIPQIPVGPFTLSVSFQFADQQYTGTASGQVTADGQNVVANVPLTGVLLQSAITLYDANNLLYRVRENGTLPDGTRDIFTGNATNRGAMLLDIVLAGSPQRFAGQTAPTTELDGRQAVVQQTLAGLNVTRKVYVPRTGYFARHVELLSNPTTAPITIDVRLTSNFRFITKVQDGFTRDREPRILATSSGDTFLDVSQATTRDRWVIVDDDDDGDPVAVNTLPVVSHVFDGPGATQNAAAASYNIDFVNRLGQLVQTWQGVTVAPGQTVALLHITSQQLSRTASQAAAGRLLQLPPEALTGLTAAEAAAIRNFAVPPVNSVPPLPGLNGTVTGRVLTGGGSASVPGALVTLQSNEVLFSRRLAGTANASGQFTFASVFNDGGTSVAIPVTAFTLQATHPQTAAISPLTPGNFPPSLITATQDIVLGNTGNLSGVVRRSNGQVVSSGSVRISGGGLLTDLNLGVAADGTFQVTGIPPGSYTVTATLPNPLGTALTATTSTLVTAGQTSNVTLTLPPTGILTGIVRRQTLAIVVGLTVTARGTGFTLNTPTDTGGRYTFSDVPAGLTVVETVDSVNNSAAAVQLTVNADQTTTQDLTLQPNTGVIGGVVTGTVLNPSGQAVSNVAVSLTSSAGTRNATTSGSGVYRFEQVPLGGFSLFASDPASLLTGRAEGNVGFVGQTVTANIQLIAVSTITGTVFRSTGAAASGAQLTITHSGGTASTIADAQGRYNLQNIAPGSFTINALDPLSGEPGSASGQLSANGESRVLDITLIGVSSVLVTVRNASNALVPGAQVIVFGTGAFTTRRTGVTQSDGTALVAAVVIGPVTVAASDSVSGAIGFASGSVVAGSVSSVAVSLPNPLASEPTFVFSLLNRALPFETQPTPYEPTFVFSALNRALPFETQPTPFEPTFVFSALNRALPFVTQPTPFEPTFVFSALNRALPFVTQPTPFEPTFVFSALNRALPFVTQPTPFEPTYVFSALNRASPVSGQLVMTELGILFSIQNLSGVPVTVLHFDTDGDGLPDELEKLLTGNVMDAKPEDDSDKDGLTNMQELRLGTNPVVADSDGDGVTDGEEYLKHHTDPRNTDTDGDRVGDGDEVRCGSDPLNMLDRPAELLAPKVYEIVSPEFRVLNLATGTRQ